MSTEAAAPIGVIGGSGLYELLPGAEAVEVDTPFGRPSGPLTVGVIGGRKVVFVPRHGPGHELQPHRIPYRANLWALRELGVDRVLAPCAVGSLDPAHPPGELVVPDQLVDRTSGRARTFHDDEGGTHAPFADPYCPGLRLAVTTAATASGWPPVDRATLVVIEGPAYSTRAESRWYAAQGWTIVGMTGCPEAVLARELGLCYAAVAVVTDLDAGCAEGEGVTHEEVVAMFAKNIDRIRLLVAAVVVDLPAERRCGCAALGVGPAARPT